MNPQDEGEGRSWTRDLAATRYQDPPVQVEAGRERALERFHLGKQNETKPNKTVRFSQCVHCIEKNFKGVLESWREGIMMITEKEGQTNK